MYTFVSDKAQVSSVDSAVFQSIQQGSTDAFWTLRNTGGVTINYHAQQNNGSTWVDIGAPNSDTNNTLTAAQVRSIQVVSDFPQVRLMANAVPSSVLEFSIARYFNRGDGGNLPLLTF